MASPFDEIVRPLEAAGLSDGMLAEINRLWTAVRAFSNTAHDVNNALQVIAGSAELLEARTLDPTVGRRLEAIRAQADRAAACIDRLVSYVRAESRPPEPTDLWPIVETAVAMRALSAGRRRVRVAVERTGADSCVALADGARLRQALLSLLLAAEHDLSGHASGRITLGIGRRGARAAVTVTTMGEGASTHTPEVPPPSMIGALTEGAERWAANYLVSSMGGGLEIASTAEGSVAVLTLPAA